MTLGSFRKFQADDYLMALALCFYTPLIVTINIVRHTSSNLLPPGYDIDRLTPQEIAHREYGSKLILVVEQCQCATVWLVKGCLVLLYLRLTSVHRENIAIKVLGAYVVITFVVMDILYFGVWCQPFHEYWAVPPDSIQCDAATIHLITNACFNLSSDIAMLLITLPIFLRMKLEWRKKIPLILLFSLGLFTILAAILNKVYSFSDPFGAMWTYWYTRESSTALLVANLPFVWTLWRRIPGFKQVFGSYLSPTQHAQTGPDEGEEIRQDSKRPASSEDTSRNSIPSDLEMLEGIPAGSSATDRRMTLSEILGEENPASKSSKEPTPITHPHLFYARKQSTVSSRMQAHEEELWATDDVPELPPFCSESTAEEGVRERGDSSAHPSQASKKSTESFA